MITKDVLITWRDYPQPDREFNTLVAIAPGWSYFSCLDEQIFFYFENEQEFNDALLNGTKEFTMKEAN